MSTIITPSQLKDSYFSDMPDFPSTRGVISVDTLNGYVNTTLLVPNKIYHNKRSFTQTLKWIEPNTFKEVIEREWRIPFTVDHNLPVSEITERIDNAMDKLGLYTYWKINYNDYTISAYVRLMEDKI